VTGVRCLLGGVGWLTGIAAGGHRLSVDFLEPLRTVGAVQGFKMSSALDAFDVTLQVRDVPVEPVPGDAVFATSNGRSTLSTGALGTRG
jgi:hypothetical protein